MCFGCSKEPSHQDGSFEYPHNILWLKNKKNNFQLHTLIWGSGKCSLTNPSSFLFPFSTKLLVIMAETHKMLVRIANRKDPDQYTPTTRIVCQLQVKVCKRSTG